MIHLFENIIYKIFSKINSSGDKDKHSFIQANTLINKIFRIYFKKFYVT